MWALATSRPATCNRSTPGLGEHEIAGLVGMDTVKVLDDLVVEERAKEFIGTLVCQAEAVGEEIGR